MVAVAGPDLIDAPTMDESVMDTPDQVVDVRRDGPAQFTVVEFPIPTTNSSLPGRARSASPT